MSDEILITGAHGQLGRDLARLLDDRSPVTADIDTLDLTDAALVDERVGDLRPPVVVNCAAWNLVDDAEDRPAEAFAANAFAPFHLARACDRAGALLIHLSTNYVFDGAAMAPYPEDAPTSPRSVYAVSKLAGEELVRSVGRRHMLVRTAGLYGRPSQWGKGGNFVETVLRLGRERPEIRVVDDQRLTPTFTEDLAAFLVRLIDRWLEKQSPELLGTWHATNAGGCTWYDFAKTIVAAAGLPLEVVPVSTEEYGARAHRPRNGLLECGRIARMRLGPLRPWKEALSAYLKKNRDRSV